MLCPVSNLMLPISRYTARRIESIAQFANIVNNNVDLILALALPQQYNSGGQAVRQIVIVMRLFSIKEADALLPSLRKNLAQIAQEQLALTRPDPEVSHAREKAVLSGGTEVGGRYIKHLIRLSQIIQEIESLGVLIKDINPWAL